MEMRMMFGAPAIGGPCGVLCVANAKGDRQSIGDEPACDRDDRDDDADRARGEWNGEDRGGDYAAAMC